MKMKNLFVLITITLVFLFSCNKEQITLAPNDLQDPETDVSSDIFNTDPESKRAPSTTYLINPFIRVTEGNCLLNLTAVVEPTNHLYSYSWKWSLDGEFSDFHPGAKLGLGFGTNMSTKQPIQQPCTNYFIELTVRLDGVELAKEVIRKKGDICTVNFKDCDPIFEVN